MRIHELAKELDVKSKELIGVLEEMGYSGLTASSSVPNEAVPRLRASGGKAVPAGKPKVVTEEPLAPARRKPRAKAAKPATKAPAKPQPETPTEAPAEPEAAAPEPEPAPTPEPVVESVKIARGSSAKEVADKLGTEPTALIRKLLELGQMVTITQSLPDEAIELVAGELGQPVEIVAPEEELEPEDDDLDPERMTLRAPVITVMGHVDHGKTLLLDAIRKTDVVSGEAGGITQAIGAYQVRHKDSEITFIDTPGHEAFTAMRARGAQVTDIAVLVVAADDGVMPQTTEAIDHAAAAGVPIVVSVNKIDKPEADPMRVRQQLAEVGIQTSEWGGDYEFVDVSAKSGDGIDKLLETLLLVAELQDLKADPGATPRGVAIEAHLDKGRGPVATVLVQQGTLRVGDAVVSGAAHGRVRAMFDEHAAPVEEAPPGKPVQVLGWSATPGAGDDFRVAEDEREARRLGHEREARQRAADIVAKRPVQTLEEILAEAAREGEIADLNLVLKADTRGSLEALADALEKLSGEEVRVQILHRGVGAIAESDVRLAQASGAVVVGFNVRPDSNARQAAEQEGVDIRTYRVIYEAVDEIKQAMSGLLTPGEEELELGRAEVRAIFQVPKAGRAAGSYVTQGTIARNARARLVRDGTIVYEGRIASLRRFKDDVREVQEGFECGIGLEDFQDVKEGDVIEAYEVREVARSL
ncbi:MAG TPA: translation initiation factor IF-2 [Actinomycetota bacterium]|nr:translation initiation factor IF-2 [Actinomycetota bacterium]